MKRFFRNPDEKKIAGVCSGLSAYLNFDLTLIRIIFVVALLCGSLGFWIYVIAWIIAPEATTPEQQCQLRGLPTTPENLRRFTK